MNTFLFQASLAVYLLSVAAYTVFFLTKKPGMRLVGYGIFLVAFLLHTGSIVARYTEAGHTPITNHHETISFFSWALASCYLSFRWRYTVQNLGVFVSPFVLLLMLIAAFSTRAITPLPPALQSWWLPVHASITLLANGFFALASIGGAMYLLQEREIKQKRFGFFYSRLPSLEVLDQLNHHCLSIGFPLLTLGIMTGSLWAKQAWGNYWDWDPKETWSLITWLLYAVVLHQRFTVGWRGRRAAILSILVFLCVLFTLWGVSFFIGGQHTYVA